MRQLMRNDLRLDVLRRCVDVDRVGVFVVFSVADRAVLCVLAVESDLLAEDVGKLTRHADIIVSSTALTTRALDLCMLCIVIIPYTFRLSCAFCARFCGIRFHRVRDFACLFTLPCNDISQHFRTFGIRFAHLLRQLFTRLRNSFCFEYDLCAVDPALCIICILCDLVDRSLRVDRSARVLYRRRKPHAKTRDRTDDTRINDLAPVELCALIIDRALQTV